MSRRTIPIAGGLAVVSVLYALQMFSPLRLDTDSVVYLTMAASAADGLGYVSHGQTDIFPHGYPALLSLLIRIGADSSAAFIGLNLLFLALGMVCGYRIIRRHVDRNPALFMCGLMAFSFVSIKYVTLAVSDFVFFGILMFTLLSFVRISEARGAQRWLLLAPALLGTAAAIYVRTIGIALVPALIWSLIPGASFRDVVERINRSAWRIAIWSSIAITAVAIAVLVLGSRYVTELLSNYVNWGVGAALKYNLLSKVREWSELVANIPFSKMPPLLGALVWPVGAAGVALAVYSVLRRVRSLTPVDVFLIAYILILFVYPANKPRYWLPILLLLMWLMRDALLASRWRDSLRWAGAAYALWFMVLGIIALGYSSRITFAGDAFPHRYGDGKLTATYEAAFEGRAASPLVKRDALNVLIRFEPRVHSDWRRMRLEQVPTGVTPAQPAVDSARN